MDISNINQIDLRNVGLIQVDVAVGPDYGALVVIDILDPGLQQRILLRADQLIQFIRRVKERHRDIVATTKVNPLPEI